MAITHEELGFPAPPSFESLRKVIERQLGRVELDGTGVSLPEGFAPNSTIIWGAPRRSRRGVDPRYRALGPFASERDIADFFNRMDGSPAITETI